MDESLESKFATLKSKNLKIDLTRGKPGSDQLDLSNDLLNLKVPAISQSGVDVRNYGDPLGIPEARDGVVLSAPLITPWLESNLVCCLSINLFCKLSIWLENHGRTKKI